MSKNWEFGLTYINSGFLSFIGDDDSFLPNVINDINYILYSSGCDILTWKKAFYGWPSHIDSGQAGKLVVPIKSGLKILNSKEELKRISLFNVEDHLGLPYEKLPCLYNSFVNIELIKKIRHEKGVFFQSRIPDVYSAIVIAGYSNNYIYSELPFSINGASEHSIGTSLKKTGRNGVSAKSFLAENNIPFHHDLILNSSIPILVAESLLQAKDNLQAFTDMDINFEKLLSCAATVEVINRGFIPNEVTNTINDIAKKNNLQMIDVDEIKKKFIINKKPYNVFFKKIIKHISPVTFNPFSKNIVLNGKLFLIKDSFMAAKLVSFLYKLTGCKRRLKKNFKLLS